MPTRDMERLASPSGEGLTTRESESVVMGKWPYILAVYTVLVGPILDRPNVKPGNHLRNQPAAVEPKKENPRPEHVRRP